MRQASRVELAAKWRERADRLDAYAKRCRRDGIIHGPEGAEDAEQAAAEYRAAAGELEGGSHGRDE